MKNTKNNNIQLYKNHRIYIKKGYQIINMPEHHLASKTGDVSVHRAVAEEKIGRQLKPEEIIHHIDENKLNNDPNNLMVFASNAEHVKYHMAIKYNNKYFLKQIDNIWYCEVKLKTSTKKCAICNKPIPFLNKRYCLECYKEENSKHIPSQKILEELIQKCSYEEIGREYGVTGKTVKKWCDKYIIKKNWHHDIPSRNKLTNLLLKNSRKKVAEFYNVDPETVTRWEKKYNIKYTSGLEIMCIETNTVYKTKRDAALSIQNNYSLKSNIYNIANACKTNKIYNNYHWRQIDKKLII